VGNPIVHDPPRIEGTPSIDEMMPESQRSVNGVRRRRFTRQPTLQVHAADPANGGNRVGEKAVESL